MIRFCAVLSALSLMVHAATAVDFEIVWDAARYGGIVAAPGDTVCWKHRNEKFQNLEVSLFVHHLALPYCK